MKQSASQDGMRDFIEHTLIAFREGRASPSDIDELRMLLSKDQEARRIYLLANQMDCMLESGLAIAGNLAPLPPKKSFIARGHLLAGLIGAGIAAAVAILVWIPFAEKRRSGIAAGFPETDPPLASLKADYNAQLHGSASYGANTFRNGELSLDAGIAQLNFRNGAEIVLEGECGFEILSENEVVLSHGKMWAYCPEEAYGFKVRTPSGREIIDLGTEFGVEVTRKGVTDVHVFDGLVDVSDPRADTKRLEAGASIRWTSPDGSPEFREADPGRFVSSSKLVSRRLSDYQQELRERGDLLLLYDFQDMTENHIANLASQASEGSHGKLVGGLPVAGRAEGLYAVQLENAGDHISLGLDFPEETKSLSIALWVKVDRIRTSGVSLINSDGWDLGDIHFQISRAGQLKAGINGGYKFSSPPGAVETGVWQLLAVTWDFEAGTAQLYRDGAPLSTRRFTSRDSLSADQMPSPQLGASRVGAWDNQTKFPENRELKGRIDEVMVFNHSLSAGEMDALYVAGRP